jgi:uncharacterized damage-inducible protein DinB
MQHTKWFDRKFEFTANDNIFPSIIERLRGTPIRLEEKVKSIPEKVLTEKIKKAWSIKENIGHLIDLEPLWMGRLDDILNKETYLRITDLQNAKTDEANHNVNTIQNLLQNFRMIREETIHRLTQLNDVEIFQSALHPRLKTPMRTMDHFLFVAEHDDHHLVTIQNIIDQLLK